MADDTVLIVVPDHGRNEKTNTIADKYGNYALDHSDASSSREIFCLIAGPQNIIRQNTVLTANDGKFESIDIVPTIADLLGFYKQIPEQYRNKMGQPLTAAFIK
jgi:hypothetical protein